MMGNIYLEYYNSNSNAQDGVTTLITYILDLQI